MSEAELIADHREGKEKIRTVLGETFECRVGSYKGVEILNLGLIVQDLKAESPIADNSGLCCQTVTLLWHIYPRH